MSSPARAERMRRTTLLTNGRYSNLQVDQVRQIVEDPLRQGDEVVPVQPSLFGIEGTRSAEERRQASHEHNISTARHLRIRNV